MSNVLDSIHLHNKRFSYKPTNHKHPIHLLEGFLLFPQYKLIMNRMEGLLAKEVTFESLGLDRRICKALQKQGFDHPTLVCKSERRSGQKREVRSARLEMEKMSCKKSKY